MTKELERMIALMPDRAAHIIKNACEYYGSSVNEIRLRADRPASLSIDGANVTLDLRCTVSELKGVLLALCDGSPYAYSDAIGQGYIPQKNGVRCGVCPTKGAHGSIDSVSSICLRFPWEHTPPEGIGELCVRDGRILPTLFYSP
ncbi:MAG: hypothetical protein IJ391_07005, partial [Clostridia bacterium]|nr:hypothetical protein [Clostridia bacterium]